MENFAQVITQPWMVIVFVSIILLVALRPFYQAIFVIKKVDKDLDIATKFLTELGKNHQDEFYNQFKTINTQILRIPGLRHAWREFVDSMYFESAALPNAHKKAYLSHRPSHYFNRDSVLGTRLNLSQFLAYPNYLIGIGLTFTFIGLAAALHVAQAGLANGAGQQALKDLLAVASIKFISSIVGIASSLFISALQRVRIRTFQQKLDAFCDLLEECTKYKSTEKLLHDSFNEQHKQTVLLNDLPKNIALSISDALSAPLASSVTAALDPLAQEIKALAQRFTESSETALKKMVTEFLSELRKNSVDDIQALMDSAKALKESLDGIARHMESAGKSFDSSIETSTNRASEALKNFVTSFAPIQGGLVQFGQSLHMFETIAGKLEQAGGNINTAADSNKKTASEFGQAMTALSVTLAPMAGLFAGLSQSLGKLSETASTLKEAGGTIAVAANGFTSSASLIERSGDKFNQKIELLGTSTDTISTAIAKLEKTSGQLGDAALPLKELCDAIRQLTQQSMQLATQHPVEKNKDHYFSKLKSKWRK